MQMRPSGDHVSSAVSGFPGPGRWACDGPGRRLLAESAELGRRVQRRAPVLASMAQDLADRFAGL